MQASSNPASQPEPPPPPPRQVISRAGAPLPCLHPVIVLALKSPHCVRACGGIFQPKASRDAHILLCRTLKAPRTFAKQEMPFFDSEDGKQMVKAHNEYSLLRIHLAMAEGGALDILRCAASHASIILASHCSISEWAAPPQAACRGQQAPQADGRARAAGGNPAPAGSRGCQLDQCG